MKFCAIRVVPHKWKLGITWTWSIIKSNACSANATLIKQTWIILNPTRGSIHTNTEQVKQTKQIVILIFPWNSGRETRCSNQLASGWLWMYSMARLQESILSASLSGISSLNSSSRAITISTLSKLSNPRSFWKCTSGVTCRYMFGIQHQ